MMKDVQKASNHEGFQGDCSRTVLEQHVVELKSVGNTCIPVIDGETRIRMNICMTYLCKENSRYIEWDGGLYSHDNTANTKTDNDVDIHHDGPNLQNIVSTGLR